VSASRRTRSSPLYADGPGLRPREIGDPVGVTERASHRIVDELAAAGYITRPRAGRRNRYSINRNQPLRESLVHEQSIGDVLAILSARHAR
jgi:DNA-binding Lrp family transcriptional regulator